MIPTYRLSRVILGYVGVITLSYQNLSRKLRLPFVVVIAPFTAVGSAIVIAFWFELSMSLIMGPLKKLMKLPANSDQTFPCKCT